MSLTTLAPMLTPTTFPRPSKDRGQRARKPFFKRFGTYLHLFIIMGIAVPSMIYLAVMENMGWRMPLLGTHGVLGFTAATSQTVSLYVSPSTKAYLASVGGNYDLLINPWRDYFADRKTKFKEVQELEQLKKISEGVLVLPSAVALSGEERQAVQEFRARGGSVLLTWASGARSARGDWEGWQFLNSQGIQISGEMPADIEVNHVILNGESPISHSQSAGQRMFVSRNSEGLLRAKGAMVAARFMNWARIPNPALRDEGAVLYTEPPLPQGRLVYYAFAESSWSTHPNVAYGLIDDSLQWLQREPSLVRAAWPNAKQAANAIEMDTEQGFPNAINFLTMMQGVDYPTSFYVLTSVGQQFPDLLQKLHRDAEVGYHGDIHIGFKDQPEPAQMERLQNMRKQMASVITDPSRIHGFRAPTEGYDATTERLIQSMGLRHHVADPNRSDGRLPLMARVPGAQPAEDVVVLPRTQRDDINLYWEKLSIEQTTQALIDDTELALENGALGLLSIHTQNYAKGSVLYQAMPGYLLHIKQYKDRLWLASTGQVADWWRERERFRISSRFSGKRLEMDVSVVGKQAVKGGTVVLMLPQKDLRPEVKSTKTTGYQPTLKILDSYRVAIVFGTLDPGDYSYKVSFNN